MYNDISNRKIPPFCFVYIDIPLGTVSKQFFETVCFSLFNNNLYLSPYLFFCDTGNSGTQIQVRTNTFKLVPRHDWHLYQYHVDFNPNVDSKRLRQFLVRVQSDTVLGKALAFDGMILYLVKKLPEKV